MPSTAKLLAASTLLAVGTAASAATVNIDNVLLRNGDTDDNTASTAPQTPVFFNFDANGSDLLVVLATGEHGFNNTSGNVTSITYNGNALTQVVERNPIASQTDTLYGDIWVLANPGAAGELRVNGATRANVAAFALSSSDPIAKPELAVRNSIVGPTTSNSVTFDTLEDSLVLAAINLGGNGNTARVNEFSPDAPLTLVGRQEEGGNWDGHVVGQTTVASSGLNTYSFTDNGPNRPFDPNFRFGPSIDGAFTYAIEIQAVPEPTSMLVGVIGIGGLLLRRRRND